LGADPFSAALYVFVNRRRDKVKLLYWERNGFCIWYKRLERERFSWPTMTDVTAGVKLDPLAEVKVDPLVNDGGFRTADADTGASSGDSGIEASRQGCSKDCTRVGRVAHDGAAVFE
jgi:hypothetical protein